MSSNKLAFTVLGGACIIAAGAGGYLAQRQNATSSPVQAAVTRTASTSPETAERPVQETEAIVPRTPSPKSAAAPAAVRPAVTPSTSTAAARNAKPEPVQPARSETAAPAERAWPGNVPAAQAPVPAPQPEVTAPQPVRPLETVEQFAQEPALLPEPPQKSPVHEELVVSADSVIGLQSETTVTSERARVEDRVEARVTRDVRVGNRVAIPAGSRAIGAVSQVERGGKFKEHARIGIRFQTVVLADGTRLAISTDAVIREGSAPGNDSAKKMGGGKGAAIGGMVGAGAGAGVVAAGDRSVATLRNGEPITIRLLSPVTVVSER